MDNIVVVDVNRGGGGLWTTRGVASSMPTLPAETTQNSRDPARKTTQAREPEEEEASRSTRNAQGVDGFEAVFAAVRVLGDTTIGESPGPQGDGRGDRALPTLFRAS